MPGIVDPAVRGNKTGNHLLLGINGDRSFQEMFSDLTVVLKNSGNTRW